MIKLEELRFKSRLGLEEFASQLEISPTTLVRIETAERQGRKYRVSHGVAYHLVESLKKITDNENVKLSDLVGVELVSPRPGRPKKKVGSEL